MCAYVQYILLCVNYIICHELPFFSRKIQILITQNVMRQNRVYDVIRQIS